MSVAEVDTELGSLNDMLSAQEAKREKEAAKAPAGFDPSAMFLLTLGFENLFDPIGRADSWQVRCKGCGANVARSARRKHYDDHRRAVSRRDTKPKERAPVTKATTKAADADTGEVSATSVTPGREASRAILTELIRRAQETLGTLDVHSNDKVGYTAIKQGGKLLAYGWLTNGNDLRFEASIQPSDIPADERVVPCKRSKDIAARTRIGDDDAGYQLAITMLTAAKAKTSP